MFKSMQEVLAAPKASTFIIRKEIEKAGSFEAWKKADDARIARNAKARAAWVAAEAAKLAK